MIKISCHKCGQRISVSDEYGGRKGKCPKCRTVLRIPVAEKADAGVAQIALDHDMGRRLPEKRLVRFNCGMCDKVIEAEESQRGAILECSGCGSFAEVPLGEKIPEEPEVHGSNEEDTGDDGEREYYGYRRTTDLNRVEATGQRKLPWFIDIFLYPISGSGLINLGLFFLGPFILSILSVVLFPLAIIFLIMRIILTFYFCWYIAECVRDSSAGGTRAPSVLSSDGDDLGGMFSAWVNLIACYLVCFGPAFFYRLTTDQQDSIYWGLMGYSALSFPILFLSVLIIDSISAWNPFMLIFSFIKLLPQYLIVSGVLFMVIWCLHVMPSIDNVVLSLFSGLIMSYAMFTGAHLLGRFYWLNKARLDWG